MKQEEHENRSRFEASAPKKAPSLLGEIAAMLRENRKYWLVPLLAVLLLLGLLIVLAGTGAAPFIYTLF